MKTKHLPLIIGIALPVFFIVLISLIIFIPSLSIKPQYNFIYSMDNYPDYAQVYRNTYSVENGHVALKSVPVPQNQMPNQTYVGDEPNLYIYDIKTNSSHQITLNEADQYTVDPGPSSPDGYTVRYEYGNDGIFDIFGSNANANGYFIEKGSARKQLTGMVDNNGSPYYQGDFGLIGWIR